MGKLDGVSVLTSFELFKTTINQAWVEVGIVGAVGSAVKLFPSPWPSPHRGEGTLF
jgi:hypothetical protein